jgi:hypothetical protein
MKLFHLRELSARHESAGNIAPRVYRTVRETGGRPGNERRYGEADALFLVTRAETPKAIALTREMIQVFIAARRGLWPTNGPEMLAQVAALRAEVATLQQALATGIVGADVAEREILVPLRRIAGLRGVTAKQRRSWRSRVERQLRNLLGHTRRGATWARLDRRLLAVAQNQVGAWLDEAIADARRNPPGQLSLDITPPTTTH